MVIAISIRKKEFYLILLTQLRNSQIAVKLLL